MVTTNTEKEIPLVYLWIFKKMCDKWGMNNTIVYSTEIIEIIRRTVYQIPKKYDYFILNEMVNYKLLEPINKKRHKILGSCANKKLKKLENYFLWNI